MDIRRVPRTPLIVLALFLLMGIPSIAEFYTDWLWFGEVGYRQVFWKSITTRSLMGSTVFVLAGAFLALNLFLALRTMPLRNIVVVTPEGPRTISLQPRRLRPVIWLVSGLAALLLAGFASSGWQTYLQFSQGLSFGAADPILDRDVSFYVFRWPFLSLLQQLLFVATLLAMIGTVGAYALAGNLGLRVGRGVFITESARRHLALLAGLMLVALAYGNWLAISALLFEPSGLVSGGTYTDVHARMPALRLLGAVGLAGAGLAVYQSFSRSLWPIATALIGYALVSLGGTVYASAIQRFIVAPNEQVRETPFILHNIAGTRAGFALDSVEERSLTGDAELTRADLERNAATIKNVPLWNHQPLLDTFSQIQEIRTYYDFVSVDNDRYVIDGEYRQIMLSGRELNSESLPNRTWINERLTFTHGYGLTLGPVNEVTPEGLPILFIRNLPPESTVDLPITEPSIYFGELSSDHVFVRTNTREFHYPEGEDNVFTTYDGEGGVSIGSFWRKLLFAVRFGSGKTLLADDLTDESRVLYYRRIQDRVRKIAPFLTYDQDPYLAIDEGRLFWIQDAYTTSSRYPYSTTLASGTNYIRASVKVVIDAYHGHTRFYMVDAEDPILRTLARIFPDLFRPLDGMPEGLRARLRYPQDIFNVQSSMFATYHMQNPAVFYNKEDQWEVPSIDMGQQAMRMEPYYTIMKLPGEPDAEFIQMLPFTPRQKDNLAAWLVARSDGEHYGKLVAFQFPKQKVVFGPRQVVARINQDQIIAPQITLWNQQGSEVIQGTLLVIPIEESLIYIRPLYLRAAGGRIPELKRVIVAYQNRIVMEETLDQALERIFPRDGQELPPQDVPDAAEIGRLLTATPDVVPDVGVPPAAAAPTPTPAPVPATPGTARADATQRQLVQRADDHYRRAMDAQRSGDWARYGDEIRRLGEVLRQMRDQE